MVPTQRRARGPDFRQALATPSVSTPLLPCTRSWTPWLRLPPIPYRQTAAYSVLWNAIPALCCASVTAPSALIAKPLAATIVSTSNLARSPSVKRPASISERTAWKTTSDASRSLSEALRFTIVEVTDFPEAAIASRSAVSRGDSMEPIAVFPVAASVLAASTYSGWRVSSFRLSRRPICPRKSAHTSARTEVARVANTTAATKTPVWRTAAFLQTFNVSLLRCDRQPAGSYAFDGSAGGSPCRPISCQIDERHSVVTQRPVETQHKGSVVGYLQPSNAQTQRVSGVPGRDAGSFPRHRLCA